jgi:hypothetical protein
MLSTGTKSKRWSARAWQPGQAARLLGVAGRNLGAPTGQLPLWVQESG